jgi:exosortase E/protease (VPEID-CTERM system)
MAISGFHTQAGWLAFSGIGIGLVLLVEKFQWFRKVAPKERSEYPSVAFVVPLLATVLAHMVCKAFSVEFDIFYPLRTLFVAWVLFCFWEDWYPLVRDVSWRYAGALGLAVYVFWIVLVPVVADPLLVPGHSLDSPWTEVWIVCRVVGAVLIVPVVEELAFRGYLLRRLQAPDFDHVAIGSITLVSLLVSSLCFGLLHGDGPRTWVAGLGAGLAYALVTRHRGRLGDAVAAHGVTNLCLSIQVLALHQWSLWS